jgi:hypothetical protein
MEPSVVMHDLAERDGSAAREELLAHLRRLSRKHMLRSCVDSSLRNALVVASAFAGFASIFIGFYLPHLGWLAGCLGAIPTVAMLVIMNLHCIKAANWHERAKTWIEGLILRLQYEQTSAVDLRLHVAKVSADLRTLQTGDAVRVGADITTQSDAVRLISICERTDALIWRASS